MPPTAVLDPASPSSAPPDDAEPTSERGSLRPVLEVIPAEAYENPTWKGLAYFGRDLLVYGACVAALIAFSNPLIVLPVLVVTALAVSALFIVGHDAAHGALFRSSRLNEWVGRVAMLPSWHVFEGWRLGHNRVHHHYTVRQDFDFVWHPYTADQYRSMNWFQRLRHRFEWSWLGAGPYYIREIWWKRMAIGDPPRRWVQRIRRDRFVVLGFVLTASAALAALGWHWSLGVLGTLWLIARVVVLPYVAFSYVIGALVHVHHIQPDIRWWKRREWTKWHGQMDGTTVLRVPKGLDFFLHWIMIHIPHHVDVRIPMYNLELATDAVQAAFPEIHDEPLRFRDYVRNTRQCKLYDFDEGRWLTYREVTH